MIEWISNNKEWFFSGIGVFFIASMLRYFFKRKSDIKIKTSEFELSIPTDTTAEKMREMANIINQLKQQL